MAASTERPLATVAPWIWTALVIALVAQIVGGAIQPRARTSATDLSHPPHPQLITLATFGEPVAAAKLMMLWLQAFDYQSGNRIAYRDLDYEVLEAWLSRILTLDPSSQYALMSATRLYAEVPEDAKKRRMIDFVFREYLKDPNRRWPWAAHAAVIAKHQLHDRDLSLRIARALQQHTTTADAPTWVRTMEEFVSDDLDELEATRVLIGGLLATGQKLSERERRLLHDRLERLEQRLLDLRK